MRLFFQNRFHKEILVKEVSSEQEAMIELRNYVRKLNPNFEIHYIRSWGENPITYDVGSHTEFFKLYKED